MYMPRLQRVANSAMFNTIIRQFTLNQNAKNNNLYKTMEVWHNKFQRKCTKWVGRRALCACACVQVKNAQAYITYIHICAHVCANSASYLGAFINELCAQWSELLLLDFCLHTFSYFNTLLAFKCDNKNVY